jgi:hypothetical protein
VRIEWKDLVSEHGGVLPITFTATVTLVDGTLTFDSSLDNKSSLPVETIDYPYLGDLNPPTRTTPMSVHTMWITWNTHLSSTPACCMAALCHRSMSSQGSRCTWNSGPATLFLPNPAQR